MSKISGMEMLLLSRIVSGISENVGSYDRVNLRLLAKEHGLDIDKVMKEVIRICETEQYYAGCHMFCTRANVIPHYKKDGQLLLDRDHAEGLLTILAVHYGRRNDF